jgi:hypothetical protein
LAVNVKAAQPSMPIGEVVTIASDTSVTAILFTTA